MFSEILRMYDNLICKISDIKVSEVIDIYSTINSNRTALMEKLSLQNKRDAEKRAQELVREFVASGDELNFFNKILAIRSQTQDEYDEHFTNSCKHWNGILDIKEEQIHLLLKERLALKPINFGKINEQNLEWDIIGINAVNNHLQLIVQNPIESVAFKKSGYTDVEDDDSSFGCAELSCSWSRSDVRQYLNTVFYEHAFSDVEKELILQVKRHVNKDDFLIPNDISNDYVYLLDLEEFLMMPADLKNCPECHNCSRWWLAEEKTRGWDDTGELPKIYTVDCLTGNLHDNTANEICLLRPIITVSLKDLINILEK